jgi:hypothetical protein
VINGFDLDALMATFAEDALANDHRSEFRGRDATRDYATGQRGRSSATA